MQTDEIIRLNNIYKRLLSNAGVKLYEGEGTVVGPNEVQVTQIDGTKLSYSARHILIATGSRAQRPNIPGQVVSFSFVVLSCCMFSRRYLSSAYESIFFLSCTCLPVHAPRPWQSLTTTGSSGTLVEA